MNQALGKWKTAIDTTDIAGGDSIAAYLTSSSGALIESTTVGGADYINVYGAASKAEDAAHASGDIGEFSLAVRRDTRSSGTSADGDYASFNVNASGDLYVTDFDGNALLTTIDASLNAIETDTGTIAGDTTSIDATLTALSKAEDSVHTSGDQGIMSLAVRNDAGTALAANGDYIPLSTDASGNLRVAGTFSVDFSYDYAEDAAATSGDIGAFVLAVRQDTLAASTSADGDYAAFKVNNVGSLYVHDTAANTTLSSILTAVQFIDDVQFAEDAAHTSGDKGNHVLAVRKDAAGSNVSADGDYASFIQWGNGETKVVDVCNTSVLQQEITLTTGGTAQQLPPTSLAFRKSVLLQNTSDKDMFVGTSTVTSSGATKGILLPRNGGVMEFDAGPNCQIWAVCATSSKSLTVLEMA
jgi:hypothetical protein